VEEKIADLNKNSSLALYQQLEQEIKRMIREGELGAGEKLPSERKLAADLDISRMTVHRALNNLEQKNYLKRKQGRGTFVAADKKIGLISPLASFSREMEDKGVKLDSEITSWHLRQANNKEALVLKLPDRSEIFVFVRLRKIEQQPALREEVKIPAKFCPDLKPADLEKNSLYDLLVNRYALELKEAEATIEPVSLAGDIAQELGVAAGELGLFFQQLTYLSEDEPLEWTKAYYSYEKHKFKFKLKKSYDYNIKG